MHTYNPSITVSLLKYYSSWCGLQGPCRLVYIHESPTGAKRPKNLQSWGLYTHVGLASTHWEK